MKKRVITTISAVIIMVGVFFTGVYASENWKIFKGDATKTNNNIDEIMKILDEMDKDKIGSEEGLKLIIKEKDKEISSLTTQIREKDDEIDNQVLEIQRFVDINKEYYDKILKLTDELKNRDNDKEHIKHLENEIDKAEKTIEELNNNSDEALSKAKKYMEGK